MRENFFDVADGLGRKKHIATYIAYFGGHMVDNHHLPVMAHGMRYTFALVMTGASFDSAIHCGSHPESLRGNKRARHEAGGYAVASETFARLSAETRFESRRISTPTTSSLLVTIEHGALRELFLAPNLSREVAEYSQPSMERSGMLGSRSF